MVEFLSAAIIKTRYPEGLRQIAGSPRWETLAGQPTDDSERALALTRTLAKVGFDIEAIAEAYALWLDSSPFDVGGTTRMALQPALEARNRGQRIASAAMSAANTGSESNGALMRQSPLAIWGHKLDPLTLDHIVRADTALTHPNIVCQDASAVFIIALATAMHDELPGREAYRVAWEWNASHGSSPSVTEVLAKAAHSKPNYEHHIGHVLIALQNAFYQVLHAPSFEEGVVDTVMGGGDTDTNGAIVGALLGGIYGLPAAPTQWRDAVLSCRPAAGTSGVNHPRPEIYWPVDLLDLAEQLLEPDNGVAIPKE